MIVIDEDHYVVTVAYGAGSHTLTRESVDTRYAFVAVRILFDPGSPGDIEEVHSLQNALQIAQQERGNFEVPATWSGSTVHGRRSLTARGSSQRPSQSANPGGRTCQSGWMFWFSLKRFVGS